MIYNVKRSKEDKNQLVLQFNRSKSGGYRFEAGKCRQEQERNAPRHAF